MKTILLVFVFFHLLSNVLAQEGSIEILPESGINSKKTGSLPNHKITVKTESENYGFMQKTDQIEVGTLISNANGGYASYNTTEPNNLHLTTNSQIQQITFNILNFMGIGGQPYNALHVYGNIIISEVTSNYQTFKPFLKVDNDGKLNLAQQTSYVGFPRSSFIPIIRNGSNPIAESNEGGLYFTNPVMTRGFFEAPINLPTNAVITGVEFYYLDNSDSDMVFSIIETELGSINDSGLSSLGSSGADAEVRVISNNNINNGGGIVISEGSTYRLRTYAFNNNPGKHWDGEKTQLIAAKLTYLY